MKKLGLESEFVMQFFAKFGEGNVFVFFLLLFFCFSCGRGEKKEKKKNRPKKLN